MAKETVKDKVPEAKLPVEAPPAQANLPATRMVRGEAVPRRLTASIVVTAPANVDVVEDVDIREQGGPIAGPRVLPIIRVLQGNSPQIKRGHSLSVAGAKEGDFFNTSTNEVYDGDLGLYFIPVAQRRMYVDYVSRDDNGGGGGFVGVYEPEHPFVRRSLEAYEKEHGNVFGKIPALGDDGKQLHGADGDEGRPRELVETYYIDAVCVVPNPDGSYPAEFGLAFEATIAFQSTFIREYRKWDNRLGNMTYNVPLGGRIVPRQLQLWAHVWRIQTKLRQGNGQSWMVPNITFGAGETDPGDGREWLQPAYKNSRQLRNDPMYLRAEALHEATDISYAYDKDTGGSTSATEPEMPGFESDDQLNK